MARPTAAQLTDKSRALGAERKQLASEWLLADVNMSLTFAALALDENSGAQKRTRNRDHARRGYDAVCHFMKRVEIPPAHRRNLTAELEKLKSMLEEAGEQF